MSSNHGFALSALTVLFFALAGCPSLPPASNNNLNGGNNANANVGDDDDAPLNVFTDPKPAAVSVVAPAGAALDAGALTVRTLRSAARITGGNATVEVLSDFPSFVQAFDAADKPVLAGFVTPGGRIRSRREPPPRRRSSTPWGATRCRRTACSRRWR